jgi:OHCU decarboxylase
MTELPGLQRLNALAPDGAEALLLTCCGSNDWAQAVAEARPFHTFEELLATADRVWWSLDRLDWLEAFASHPEIGDQEGTSWSRAEQAGAHQSSPATLDELHRLNAEYVSRFGHTFIICATGKTGDDMLATLKERLGNDPETELRIAAEEQRQIMHLRLSKLVHTI